MPSKSASNSADQPQRMTLADLVPSKGSVRERKRVGRGRSSGHGKTASRGNNGEGQRAGRSRKVGFEGGQMPLFRRLPRMEGFQLVNRKRWAVINVCDLERLAVDGKVTLDDLIDARIFNPNRHNGVRLLGNGDSCPKGLSIEVHYVSAAAKEKLEAAGAKLELV
ncbi:MAG: 50S ribosomal protein L15 [Vampirovibrionales bacterium]